MLITRTSIISGIERTRDIAVTPQEMEKYENRHITGELIQNIFPRLSAGDREFILTGISDKEWDEIFQGNMEEMEMEDNED